MRRKPERSRDVPAQLGAIHAQDGNVVCIEVEIGAGLLDAALESERAPQHHHRQRLARHRGRRQRDNYALNFTTV
jgi:hypothetical protein